MILFDLVVNVLALSCRSHLVSGKVLKYGTPGSVGMISWSFVQLEKKISAHLIPENYSSATYNEIHPVYPGATVMIGYQSTIVSHFAVGEVIRYANENGSELENLEKISAKLGTIYDLVASLSKLFTTILALQQLERGAIGLDCTVSTYIPNLLASGQDVTILQLLTHTAGFDADPAPPLWTGYASYNARRQAIITQGLMTMQIVLEIVTGLTFGTLLERDFTGPLRISDIFFNPGNLALDTSRIAATEFQAAPVWGTVHDENAWSLDGVFSTAKDMGFFCVRILKPQSVDKIFTDYNTAFPVHEHGLTARHMGFTGTSMVINRPSNTSMILLTNRVHPSRNWSSPNIARQMVGYWVRKALGFNE
ncbi:putative beta-lactamase [Desarmillaria tabescens]|uniref:Beta-lactamase n=1 Tax=Armillaria tabescens TaxID=1929756 RepID=A0AA39J948_ARMTA|nr:putative beta-lactamase [Desarmillaria tabescens]KAK0438323.1 putative beta-lactamase [Desarmillaria tabescens]